MIIPLDTFQGENIPTLLMKLMDQSLLDPSRIFLLTFGSHTGSEKTGRLIGINRESDTICIQKYRAKSPNTFEEEDGVIYISITSLTSLELHQSESFSFLRKKSTPAEAIEKLGVRRDITAKLRSITGSGDLDVDFLWDTIDIEDGHVVDSLRKYLMSLTEAIQAICADEMGKNAWNAKLKKLIIQGSSSFEIVRDETVLNCSFDRSGVSKGDIKMSIENVL